MKNIIFGIVILSIVLVSCNKHNQVKISYEATASISEYSLYYKDADGNLAETVVTPQSAQDKWVHTHLGVEGDIVYISGIYSDINSGLKMVIKLDGKIYKQASNVGDTLKYLTVSGVVPYN